MVDRQLGELQISEILRRQMIDNQIRARGLSDERVLAAVSDVPRETFVPARLLKLAYEDMALPIPAGQTISQPYIVALMITLLQLKETDRVLEVGTGSGYAAAILSRLVEEVYGIERHNVLVEYAQQRLTGLGYENVTLRQGDGTLGWVEEAPFDAILVSASGPNVPKQLQEQLKINGRLVMPVGLHRLGQVLMRYTRISESEYKVEELSAVTFVPLIGEEGWSGK